MSRHTFPSKSLSYQSLSLGLDIIQGWARPVWRRLTRTNIRVWCGSWGPRWYMIHHHLLRLPENCLCLSGWTTLCFCAILMKPTSPVSVLKFSRSWSTPLHLQKLFCSHLKCPSQLYIHDCEHRWWHKAAFLIVVGRP